METRAARAAERVPRPTSGLVPGVIASVRFTDLLANGQAVGRMNGLVVFVTGPLPGERAKVRVVQVKPKYAVGEVLTYETQSEMRAKPFCGVFGVCGGCQVQHLAYPAQLAWKEQIVRSALRRIGGFADADVRRPVGMTHPRNYRNKMALVVDSSFGETSFGFYQARSHALVRIETCPVVLPQLDAAIAGLYDASRAADSADAFAGAKHAIVRAGAASAQAVLSITTERQSAEVRDRAPAIARRVRGVVGVSNSFEPRTANAVLGRKMAYVWGRREMEETIEGVRYRVSPASFFQVNSEMVGRIFRFLTPPLAKPRNIVDLYCGAGTFAIYFASRGANVVGVEENPAAVREARENAALNEVESRVRFVEGRVEGAVANKDGQEALAAADIVFLDPPRKGSDEATLDAIATAQVPNIWYLSCNPATLARDLAFLAKRGYSLGIVQPFDMFPQTGHVETLAALHYIGKEPEVMLPEREATPWDDRIPEWPSDDPYARSEYPDFVDVSG
ncbi:MAG: 23S rRNA (uracil(1939)-C(5))-methyltransferase RlmD [Candidatus Eremiobacteraeota bacterium]|nr:23S rRNA (uracil(1939)-C(5))-methyltransferase RlmD [Candidatus Eremiobacteraeota bacterium]